MIYAEKNVKNLETYCIFRFVKEHKEASVYQFPDHFSGYYLHLYFRYNDKLEHPNKL